MTMTQEPLISIFNKVSNERDYQDHMCILKGIPLKPTIEGEIVMIKTYVDKMLVMWTENPNDKKVLSEMRKIAGIAVRCLQNYGCPQRDMLSSLSNGEI